MKRILVLLTLCILHCALCIVHCPSCILFAQSPVSVGAGSYASFVPLAESASSQHGGCQAYMMEHRPIYAVDSLLARPLPSNEWWTYALISPWTGNLWFYPGVTWANESGVSIAKLTHWEPTGSEMKWDEPLLLSTVGVDNKPIVFTEKKLADWSDFMIRYVMTRDSASVEVTVMRGAPLVWLEYTGCRPAAITNPAEADYAVFQQNLLSGKTAVAVGILTEGLTADDLAPYAFRIPRNTAYSYVYTQASAQLTTTFHIDYTDLVPSSAQGLLMGFLPHHYQNTIVHCALSTANYQTPRGTMRLAFGNDFAFTYAVHSMLPFFPLPTDSLSGYSSDRMQQLCQQYAAQGNFGADTYWGGKGLTQMMHYMTAAMQLGDTVTYRLAKQRLKETLIDWYTYTPGETQFYFARYPRWGALVGFDPSYDSDTFNDHHFHYGYFIYASGVLCMLDPEFREQYGLMAREVARDYANWLRDDSPLALSSSAAFWGKGTGERGYPLFRMFSPYDGHSYAGGMGNAGNGNGQESTSEAMQSWIGIWMLGAALGDEEMLAAGVMGYTVEARATAEYWFDRNRRNIDYSKYLHPYCCNLTMAGVGWWTWFSGDPVWMHSIQWLPISPGMQNYLSEDRAFARWDYSQMYASKEVGNYEAATGGLGDESGLGNVCLSYLALFDADSAARVWDRMDRMGKNLAKNADTGGITYMLAHGIRQWGNHNPEILSDYELAAAYTTDSGDTTYMVFNAGDTPLTVHFYAKNYTGGQTPCVVLSQLVPHALTIYRSGSVVATLPVIADDTTSAPVDSIAAAWTHTYPNIALHKSVTVSSYENAGCLAANLTDGDLATRWGSTHNDNEWACVDLGAQYYIDHLVLRWEAAYASQVEIAISDDMQTWQTVTFSGTGGNQRVNLASLIMAEGGSSRARYLRLTGLSRATAYGTSLYELEAYGLPLTGNPSEVIALEITSSDISLVPGQTPQYEVRGYNYLGQEKPVTPIINQQSSITQYEVSAEFGGLTASYSWPVLEQVQTTSISVTPAEVTLVPGDRQVFEVSALDQFGYPTATDYLTYEASALGTFLFPVELNGLRDTATIHVVSFSCKNLALGKMATCSGSENDGTGANKAVDGLMSTRWSSRFRDEEWLQVDLGDNFLVNHFRLQWEAAYATFYEILVSTDNSTWTSVYDVICSSAGLHDILICPAEARYVRLVCHTRSTGYGASLWELEVYGVEESDPDDPACQEEPEEPDGPKTWYDACANSGVELDYYLVYNTDKTISVFVTNRRTEHTGLAALSFSIDGEWRDLSLGKDGIFSRTSSKTFERGMVVHCFFYQPYTNGAARMDFDYAVGASNNPPTPIESVPSGETLPGSPRKILHNGHLLILHNSRTYNALGQIIK